MNKRRWHGLDFAAGANARPEFAQGSQLGHLKEDLAANADTQIGTCGHLGEV